MKRIFLALIIAMTGGQIIAQTEVRTVENFNFGWRFHYGEVENVAQNGFDDSRWRVLDLPHDFQIEQPWSETASKARGFKEMGVGWYRKTFAADVAWKGRKVLLDFEGIMLVGDVWVNGAKVGGTDYGYLGFEVDITELIDCAGKNTVAVRAETGRDENSRWYTGGGLFRDVHLVVKNPVSVARHGVFVTVPAVSESYADVAVQVDVEGLSRRVGGVKIVDIEATILSPEGVAVGSIRGRNPAISKKRIEEVQLPPVRITAPRLWSCETPHLYSVAVAVRDLDGTLLDRVHETFGIRSIEFSKDFGFKLNGKKVFLKGVSNHHDLGAVGVAAYESAVERMFIRLKSFGFNHIRCSHNPYSESFLRLADKHGILIVDELFDKWTQQHTGGRVPFTTLFPVAIPEWVKRDRNHPSVVLWSLGNELQSREEHTGIPSNDWGVTAYRILDILVKRYDPTRKTTVAMFPARRYALMKSDPEFDSVIEPPELAAVTDVASFNYRWNAYERYRRHVPHMIFYQSEATTRELAAPYFGMDRDKMVGLAYWGESDGWPHKGWHYSFFDHTLNPYPQAYLIKSIFSAEPLVHIGVAERTAQSVEWNDIQIGKTPISENWNRVEGSAVNLFTYTNADEVELFVNGRSLGVQRNDTSDVSRRNAVFWKDVRYERGKITAVARNSGKEVARHQLETTGKAVALVLKTDAAVQNADGMSLQYVEVYAVDDKGRIVTTADNEITVEASGDAARLIVLDSGDHTSDVLFNVNKRPLYNGRALAILRSTKTAGSVKVKVSAAGLKSAEKFWDCTGYPECKGVRGIE